MRIRVFSHRANVATDRPLFTKSLDYITNLVRGNRAYVVDDRSVKLYPPPVEQAADADRKLRAELVRGRNSCSKIARPGYDLFRVSHFSYPIPASGAHGRNTSVRAINYVPEPQP